MQSFNFHPVVAEWFQGKFGTPTEPQLRGWPAIQSGRHALICAPTGSGKTLAAFLAALDKLFTEGTQADLPDETRVLYVSPLRALSNDIRKNLQEPLNEIRALLREKTGRDVAVGVQVGTVDTSAAERQAIAKRPPHILVTTPESFYLLLTSESGRRLLRTIRTLIVDEIHALVDDRRGAHLAISMERLAHLAEGPIQRIGLSATQKPIEEVARFLVGTREVSGGEGVSNAEQAKAWTTNREQAEACTTNKEQAKARTTNEGQAEACTTNKEHAKAWTTNEGQAKACTTNKEQAKAWTTNEGQAEACTTNGKPDCAII